MDEELSHAEWSQIIEPRGVHKMLYSLQLIQQLIKVNSDKLSDQEVQERLAWRYRFLQLGGFKHLYNIFVNYKTDSHQSDDLFEEMKEQEQQQQRVTTDRRIETQCLQHLVGILKLFVQAAIISLDHSNKLLQIVAASITSPFKKAAPPPGGQGAVLGSYGGETSSITDGASDNDTSSVKTAKFGQSFSKMSDDIKEEEQKGSGQQTSQISQIDDFPKLIK